MTAKHWKTGLSEMQGGPTAKTYSFATCNACLPAIRDEDLAPGGSGVRAQAVARNGALLDDFNILRGTGSGSCIERPLAGRNLILGHRRAYSRVWLLRPSVSPDQPA